MCFESHFLFLKLTNRTASTFALLRIRPGLSKDTPIVECHAQPVARRVNRLCEHSSFVSPLVSFNVPDICQTLTALPSPVHQAHPAVAYHALTNMRESTV